jgi:hypothetical protein
MVRAVNATPRTLFTPGQDPVPTVKKAGWAPEPVGTGAENLDPKGNRSPDRPARSESLYRLSYLGPLYIHNIILQIAVFFPFGCSANCYELQGSPCFPSSEQRSLVNAAANTEQ